MSKSYTPTTAPLDGTVRPLVERLRDFAGYPSGAEHLMEEASDEIERLRALLARCRPIIEADAQMMAAKIAGGGLWAWALARTAQRAEA